MATRRRSAAAAAIPKAAIEQVSVALQDLPEKPRESLSLREAVSALEGSITAALDRGYSYDEVVNILANQGVDITVTSLKRYLAAARKESDDTPKKSRRGKRSRQTQSDEETSDETAEAALSNGAFAPAEPEAEPAEEATPKRRRASSRSKASDASTERKTAAKSKPTSRAKSTSRSTASRGRRKKDVSE